MKIYPGKFAKVARKPEKTFIRCFILWQLKTFYTLKIVVWNQWTEGMGWWEQTVFNLLFYVSDTPNQIKLLRNVFYCYCWSFYLMFVGGPVICGPAAAACDCIARTRCEHCGRKYGSVIWSHSRLKSIYMRISSANKGGVHCNLFNLKYDRTSTQSSVEIHIVFPQYCSEAK